MPLSPACQTFVPLLSPFIDGELPPSGRTQVERHLAACQDCAMRAADLRAESGLVRVGMEMAADEVDFSDFALKVMAQLTPEKPPFFERLKLSISETFLYQRGTLLTAAVSAAVVMLLALPFILRERTPTGYASERMAVQSVSTDQAANVAPVVFETKSGNSIIWVVDQQPRKAEPADEAASEELELEPQNQLNPDKPKGGEL
jgi:anti-sigma factor RsiW